MSNKKRIKNFISKKIKNKIRVVKVFNRFIYGYEFKVPKEYLNELKNQSPENFKREYFNFPVEDI